MDFPRAIVFITFDCLRSDRLGCYGYEGVDTPCIDRIASEGIIFTQAISQATNTWVSHASIFTGCNPYKHGVRDPFTKLSEKILTIAEVLSKNGFATAGFPSHTLLGSTLGFNRGFDLYDLDLEDFQYCSYVKDNKYYRKWDDIWEKAKIWIEKQKGPFFIWFHYMGIHEIPLKSLSLPDSFKNKYSSSGQYYDAKVSFADKECMEPILSFFKSNNLYNNSIFVLFSDHGDKIVDDSYTIGKVKHNEGLFEDVVRIPLILCAPKLIEGKKSVANQVRSIDIMPTVLSLVDVTIPENIDGTDLTPFYILPVQKKDDEGIFYAYMENLPYNEFGLRTPEWKLILKIKESKNLSNKRKFFVTRKFSSHNILKKIKGFKKELLREATSTKKFFFGKLLFLKLCLKNANRILTYYLSGSFYRQKKNNRCQSYEVKSLYNLRNDPNERYNVSSIYPDIVTKLNKQFICFVEKASTKAEKINNEEKKKIERKLRDLGYN